MASLFDGVKNKQQAMMLLQESPGFGFAKWDNGPVYSDAAMLRDWQAAQALPFYDKEIEEAIYRKFAGFKPSPQSQGGDGELATTKYAMPPLKFSPMMSNRPQEDPSLAGLFSSLMGRLK